MSVITLFNYYKHPQASIPLLNVLLKIKNGKYKNCITKLRQYFQQDLDASFDNQKRTLCWFSVSGNFRIVEGKLTLTSYSGFMLLEIPYLNEVDMLMVRSLLENDPFVAACFTNALGLGLTIIVKTVATKEQHASMRRFIVSYYEKLTSFNRFTKLGSRIDDICLVSHDTTLYLNLEAVPFPFHCKAVLAFQ